MDSWDSATLSMAAQSLERIAGSLDRFEKLLRPTPPSPSPPPPVRTYFPLLEDEDGAPYPEAVQAQWRRVLADPSPAPDLAHELVKSLVQLLRPRRKAPAK